MKPNTAGVQVCVERVEDGLVLSIGELSVWVSTQTAEAILTSLALSFMGRDKVAIPADGAPSLETARSHSRF